MLRFLANIVRAVGRGFNSLTGGVFTGILNTMYPGMLDNAAAGAAAAEQDVDSDIWERAADANARKEAELYDVLAWGNETLAGEGRAPYPETLSSRTIVWLQGLSRDQIDLMTAMRPEDVYAHLFLGFDAESLPNVETAPIPLPEPAPQPLLWRPDSSGLTAGELYRDARPAEPMPFRSM